MGRLSTTECTYLPTYLDHPGQNKKERPQPPGLHRPAKCGLTPRAGSSGPYQAKGAHTQRTGAPRGKWRPEAKDT